MSAEPQKQVIVVQATKSVGISILLTFFFGPLGMLYSTVSGAIIMFIISVVGVLLTAGLSLLITFPICMIWGAMAASAYNKKLLEGVK